VSRESVELDYRNKVGQIGRAALHALFPNDIEYYFLAIELVDSNGNSVDYFAWPILPDEIRQTDQEITRVGKTIGGVSVLKNTTFVPKMISMRGDFGRRFKIILGGNPLEFGGFRLSQQSGKFSITPPNFLQNPIPQFSSFAKNGYGCIKVLQSIKDKSKQLDENGKPFSVYLYNPILGNNYQVEFTNFTHMQDKNNYNMIPAYSMQLTAVAPLDSVLSRVANLTSTVKNLAISNLQKGANRVASNLRATLG